MKLYVNEKLMSIPIKFFVKDENNNDVYEIFYSFGRKITIKDLKRSILEEKSFEADCRIIYLYCDPLWTEIISCPHCYYSNHYLKFFGINNFEFEVIEKLLNNEHKQVVEDRLERRSDFDIMVMKYLQAININEHVNPGDNALIGMLWRNLYWMSKDVSDIEFATYCCDNAIEKFKNVIERNELSDADSRTTIALSLAAMMIYRKEYKDVKRYLSIAAESPSERIKSRATQILSRIDKMQK